MAGDVASRLRTDGFAFCPQKLGATEFEAVGSRLGDILAKASVSLRPDVESYLCQPERIPFHTDHPDVAIVAWHCIAQDADDGASLLIDTWPLVRAFEPERLMALPVDFPARRGSTSPGRRPLLMQGEARPRVYYAPWNVRLQGLPPSQAATAAAWRLAVEVAPVIRRRLEPGQALFIDNARVLHGRGAVDPRSGRCLRRLWLGRVSEHPDGHVGENRAGRRRP